MTKFILGKKENMVQFFDEDGRCHPATFISAGPVTVTQLKDDTKDGYTAVQVGYGEQKEKRVKKAQKGHVGDLGFFADFKEFRMNGDVALKVGDKIDASTFEVGDKVTVRGTSKGKGFQGVVKRHGFHGGPRSHGQKHSEREPGSIGATGPQRVFKGTRMGGRMGTDTVSVKNLKVLGVDVANNKLLISGALPGRRGTLIEVRG
jgi:large subunit ribosomal protein L3